MRMGVKLYFVQRLLVAFFVSLIWIALVGEVSGRAYMVPMRDGVELSTQVLIPEGDGPWPTLLARTPYGRSGIDEGQFVSWGYAVVCQDWRGFGSSISAKMPFESDGWGELQDGYDTVEWIAAQDWSNGKIGTMGISALGVAQNLLAGSHPPHLVCQHIEDAPSDPYSQDYYPGGVLTKRDTENWYNQHGTPASLANVLAHPNYDSYWELLNSETRISGMRYPGFHVGGWYDLFTQGTINAFVKRQHEGGPGSAGNQKLIIGPWTHNSHDDRVQGELTYPEDATYASESVERRMFFDYWLKGIDTGYADIPTVRYYVMGDSDDPDAPGNEWRSADDWPIPHANFSLYLCSQGGLEASPGVDSADTFSYDPRTPVPTVGGAGGVASGPTGPRDQRPVEEREDVLVYTTEPLPFPVEVTGRIYMQLFASSSCPDTDFVARLTDVYPDGRSMSVTDGIIRARHRNSLSTEEFMEEGEAYEFWIDLWSTSIVFNAGHRIRVAVTSSNYPRFELNPNTGEAGDELRVADNTLYAGLAYPSRIILPLAGPDSDGDGSYDILDPLPYEADSLPESEAVANAIRETDLEISLIGDQDLRAVLQEASQRAKAFMSNGDVLESGHLVTMIRGALSYDASGVSLSESRRMVDSSLEHASRCVREGTFTSMVEYIMAGWKLGAMRDECEHLPGGSLLREHLIEAEEMMNSGFPRAAARIADWCNLTNVRSLAEDLQFYRGELLQMTGLVSERELKILEGLLSAAEKYFDDRHDEGCEDKLSDLKQRLNQLGVLGIMVFCFVVALLFRWTLPRSRGRLGIDAR